MNRKVLLFAAGGAIALLVVWFVLLWSPQGARLEDAGTRRDAAESTNSQLELRLERLRDLRERRPQLQATWTPSRRRSPRAPSWTRSCSTPTPPLSAPVWTSRR